jgi:hypothetical protein
MAAIQFILSIRHYHFKLKELIEGICQNKVCGMDKDITFWLCHTTQVYKVLQAAVL